MKQYIHYGIKFTVSFPGKLKRNKTMKKEKDKNYENLFVEQISL